MIIKDFFKLERKHDTALLLGCGPSINLLNPSHINNVDTWAINNFMAHEWLVPNYLQFEVKWNQPDKVSWLKNRLANNADKWKDTVFTMNKRALTNYQTLLPDQSIVGIVPDHLLQPIPTSNTLGLVYAYLRSKKYKTIYMIGVDLYTAEYFFANQPGIPKSFNRDPSMPHNTQKDNVVNKICNYIKTYKLNVINLSPKSDFAKFLPTESVDVLHKI